MTQFKTSDESCEDSHGSHTSEWKFDTIEDVRAYWEKNPDEVWEDDDGCEYEILCVGDGTVFYREVNGEESAVCFTVWAIDNNLPQSLRYTLEPRKVPEFWEVRYWDDTDKYTRSDIYSKKPTLERSSSWDNAIYRKEGDTDWIWLKGGE